MTDEIPRQSGTCQFCGGYNASPVDVTVMQELLGPDAIGQAHPKCYLDAVKERDNGTPAV